MPKMVIIDDEEATVDMLTTYFNLIGHEAVGAYSGHDGLAMVELEKPDIVLLDLMMPDLEGFEVCRILRKKTQFSSLPILIISARIDKDSQERAENVGADGYMTKPLNLPKLTNEIEYLLSNPPHHQTTSILDTALDTAPDGNLTPDQTSPPLPETTVDSADNPGAEIASAPETPSKPVQPADPEAD